MKNEQKIKEKYGFVWSSAHAGKILNNNQVEKYGSHLETFRHYWGFDYEKIYKQKNQIIDLYKNTLIEKFLLHNFKKGPLKTFNIKYGPFFIFFLVILILINTSFIIFMIN